MTKIERVISALENARETCEIIWGENHERTEIYRQCIDEIKRLEKLDANVELAQAEDLAGYGIEYKCGWFDCLDKILKTK